MESPTTETPITETATMYARAHGPKLFPIALQCILYDFTHIEHTCKHLCHGLIVYLLSVLSEPVRYCTRSLWMYIIILVAMHTITLLVH